MSSLKFLKYLVFLMMQYCALNIISQLPLGANTSLIMNDSGKNGKFWHLGDGSVPGSGIRIFRVELGMLRVRWSEIQATGEAVELQVPWIFLQTARLSVQRWTRQRCKTSQFGTSEHKIGGLGQGSVACENGS